MRILHTADWHIGNFPGPEKNGKNLRLNDICKCLNALVQKAEEEQPDIVIVAGDIFHQAKVWSDRGLRENGIAVRYIRQLSKIAPVAIVRGTPNHDSEQQYISLKETFRNNEQVLICDEPGTSVITTATGEEATIAALPGFDRGYYRAKHPGLSKEEENEVFTEELHNIILGLKAQCSSELPSILVTHFTIPGCNMESGQTQFFAQFEPVIYPSTLSAAGFTLSCFGHIHRPQKIEDAPNTFYSGAVSALNFNDAGQERGFYIHDIDDRGNVKSVFHTLPTREYKTLYLNDDDIKEINENGPECLSKRCDTIGVEDVENKVVRVLYDCTDERNKALNKANLEQYLYSIGVFWVQEITPQKITVSVNKEAMEGDNSPEELLRAYLEEKTTSASVADIIETARPIIAEAIENTGKSGKTGTFKPMKIAVKNYRNYRDEEFDYEGIRFCTINGENGAGKSSLFMDAMLDALYEQPREGDLTGWICNDPAVRSGSIQFTFSLGDAVYRVTRTRQKSGKATLNLAELIEGEWTDRSAERYRETQAIVENTIGMDSLTFKACALIMQDQYGLFLQADKEARMAILGNILGLGIYEKMEDIAANKLTETNREIRLLNEKVADINAKLPDANILDTQIADHAAKLAGLEEQVEKKTAEIDSTKVRLNTKIEAKARVTRLANNISALTFKKQGATSAITSQTLIINGATATLAEESTIQEGVQEYERLREREKDLVSARDRRDELSAQDEKLSKKITTFQGKRDEIQRKIASAELELSDIDASLNDTETIKEKHNEYLVTKDQTEKMQKAFEEFTALEKSKRDAEAELNLLRSNIESEISSREYVVQTLKQRVALLDDCGCPIADRATCKFLEDAMKAKEELPGKEKELGEYRASSADKLSVAQGEVSLAKKALANNEYSSTEMNRLKAILTALQPFEERYHSLGEQKARKEATVARIEELDNEIEGILQSIEEAEAEHAIIHKKLDDAKTAAEDYDLLVVQIKKAHEFVEKEKELPAARERLATATARLEELKSEVAQIETEIVEKEEELAHENQTADGASELEAVVRKAEAEIRELRESITSTSMELGALRNQKKAADEDRATAEELMKKTVALGEKASIFDELKKAFSQDGIPHNVIRSIIPIFEATATGILGQMSGGRMSVEFVTEKHLKSNNKKEVTTLDIIINDVTTGRLPYMSRSGGERVKSALSVILALSEIKSSKAGIQLGFLFIDEPPFLDAQGVQAYCDALEAIQSRYANLKIMAITHDPTMKSRFPQSVDVVKTPEGSKVIYQ